MRQYDVKKIEWLSLLGQGTFSYVWKCKYKDEVVAIKRTCKCSNKISREYEILQEVSECEHSIALYDIFYSKNEQGQVFQHLITEYVEQSLYDVLSSSVILSPSVIKSLMHQLLTACQFLHSRNIVHRDLKPENILLRKLNESSDKEYLLKICDFGSSKKLDPQKMNNPYVVSRFYRAPELCLAMTNYTTKIDIFSVGCIFIELYSKQAFFKSKKDEEQI